jgi:lysophospholipase L1-like esterase
MATQPTASEFSFSKYMQRFASAYADSGAPTHIALMSGANDFYYSSEVTQAGFDSWQVKLDTVIASVAAYDAAIKFYIILPIGGSDQDGAGKYQGAGPSSYLFNTNMQTLARFILGKYDTQSYRDAGIYIAPLLIAVDSVTAFTQINEVRNKYTTLTESRSDNQLHPNSAGHYQMGDCLAATIAWSELT